MISEEEWQREKNIRRIVFSYRRDEPTVVLGSGAEDGTLDDFNDWSPDAYVGTDPGEE